LAQNTQTEFCGESDESTAAIKFRDRFSTLFARKSLPQAVTLVIYVSINLTHFSATQGSIFYAICKKVFAPSSYTGDLCQY